MPFRHAHWAIGFCLAPLVLIAFWPAYFADLPHAPLAFHAHGLTASAWLILLAVQSWSIHTRRRSLHRALGRALFGIVPLFAAGGALAMHSMAVKFAAGSDPFYAALGARLGLHDLVSTIMFVAMVCAALRRRRRVALHAGYMLATVLLILPPIVVRLPLPLPFWAHPGEAVAIVLALALWFAARPDGRPFTLVAAIMVAQVILFETLGAGALWASAFTAFAGASPWAVALLAAAAAAFALQRAWAPPRGGPARMAAPV